MSHIAEQELRSRVRARLRSSTLRGAGRLLDLGGTFRADDSRGNVFDRDQKRKTPAEAIAKDWQQVGSHLRSALLKFEAEHGRHG